MQGSVNGIDYGTLVALGTALVAAAGVWTRLNATIAKVVADNKNMKDDIAKMDGQLEKLWIERDDAHDRIVVLEAASRRHHNGT